jgi:hypothetical protein
MIHFVTALDCEASPIIHRYGLKPCGNHGRARFFAGDNARLVVSGVGQLRSAIATTALGARFPETGPIWLNVGIAGHREAELGTGFIANRVSSEDAKDVYYPQTVAPAPWRGISVRTLGAPSMEYPFDCLSEMEAFGFYTAALATATLEFIHVFKVVSDNATHSLEGKLSKDSVSERIASHLDSIERFAQATLENRPGVEVSDWVEVTRLEIQSIHHLSATYKHKLAKQLKQLSHLLTNGEKKVFADRFKGQNKREVFETIEREIDSLSAKRLCYGLG